MNAAKTFAASTLKEIRQEIASDSVLFGEQLLAESAVRETAGFSDLFMAAGGDGAASPRSIQLGLEYIFEGFLLHYGHNRLLKPDANNFYLLAGDYMYARGLSAIAGLEDLACIRELAELIQLCAYIHGENHDPALALNAWSVTTLRLAARMSDCCGKIPDSSGLSEIILGGNDPDDSGLGVSSDSDTTAGKHQEIVSAADEPVANRLDAVFENSLAALPAEKHQTLRQLCRDINANFLTEA